MNDPALNVAIKAARDASRDIIRLLNRNEGISVAEKAQNDFVTEVDRQVESTLIDTIKQKYPQHAIEAEESGRQGESEHCWIIDPIDGTTNLLRGIPHFAISIALQHRGRIECAVVYNPITDELFAAKRGAGATLNDKRLRVAPAKKLQGTLIATGFPFRQRQHTQRYLQMFSNVFEQVGDLRRAGSAALDLAYVAAGRVDGFFELGLESWDMAAGSLLVREAGGTVMDIQGGSDYMNSGNIVAGNLKVAGQLVKYLKS